LEQHVAWVHRFLTSLRSDRIRVPEPVGLLDGSAVAIIDETVWETVTYVPGRVVGWNRRPRMREMGAFLAAFHEASAQVSIGHRVGHNIPIAALTAEATWKGCSLANDEADVVQGSIDDLRVGLGRIDHVAASRIVIHGDFTNHNVLAVGEPLSPGGVIDFSNTYSEAALADVGFGLWRSGRPTQHAGTWSPSRIASYLAGYHSRRPLGPRDVDAVMVYLQARGLQIAAKQARDGRIIDQPLTARLAWLHDHAEPLRNHIAQRRRAEAN
jgi:Ser/Thr protein kinase RdoA (MazF antagonist)